MSSDRISKDLQQVTRDRSAAADPWSLREMVLMLKDGWFIIMAVVLLALGAGLALILVSTPQYTTTMKVVPIAPERPGLNERLGALASLAGVSLGVPAQRSDLALFLDGLRSQEVAREIARDESLLRQMFPQEWDPRARSWQRPKPGLLQRARDSLLGLQPYSTPPDAARIQEFLDRYLTTIELKDSPIVLIRIEHPDRLFSQRLLDRLASHSDRLIRERALARAVSNIAFLNAQLQQTSLADQRAALASLLLQQEQIRMLASASLPYAVDVVSGPTTGLRPSSPNVPLILGVSAAGGFFLATLFLLARREWRLEVQGAIPA